MARPNKSKRVWRLPLYPEFLTKGRETAANKMILSVEEFETLRLLDYLGMTQEEFSEAIGILMGTLWHWISVDSECPVYTQRMLAYMVELKRVEAKRDEVGQ